MIGTYAKIRVYRQYSHSPLLSHRQVYEHVLYSKWRIYHKDTSNVLIATQALNKRQMKRTLFLEAKLAKCGKDVIYFKSKIYGFIQINLLLEISSNGKFSNLYLIWGEKKKRQGHHFLSNVWPSTFSTLLCWPVGLPELHWPGLPVSGRSCLCLVLNALEWVSTNDSTPVEKHVQDLLAILQGSLHWKPVKQFLSLKKGSSSVFSCCHRK